MAYSKSGLDSAVMHLNSVFNNDIEGVKSTLHLLQLHLSKFLTDLKTADSSTLKMEAHAIKSELAFCGFKLLADKVKLIELKSSQHSLVPEIVSEFTALAAESILDINNWLLKEG